MICLSHLDSNYPFLYFFLSLGHSLVNLSDFPVEHLDYLMIDCGNDLW